MNAHGWTIHSISLEELRRRIADGTLNEYYMKFGIDLNLPYHNRTTEDGDIEISQHESVLHDKSKG